MTTDKCPHCGDPVIDGTEYWTDYDCGTTVCCKGESFRSKYCKVNSELAATKLSLENAKADAESWQAKSARFEKQCLEADERWKELEKQVHFAAGFISCVPSFTHYHPEEVFRFIQRLGKPTLGESIPTKEGGQS